MKHFTRGIEKCNPDSQLIGKFDADIILPTNYLEKMVAIFASDNLVGMASGNLYIKKRDAWVFENISEKTKVRGPIKLYKKECFEAIGGLKKSIGWDTVDGSIGSVSRLENKDRPLITRKTPQSYWKCIHIWS